MSVRRPNQLLITQLPVRKRLTNELDMLCYTPLFLLFCFFGQFGSFSVFSFLFPLFVSHDSPTGINELMLEVRKTNLLSLNKDAGHLRKLQKSKFLLNNV